MSDADDLRRSAEAGALALEQLPKLAATVAGLETTRDTQAATITTLTADKARLDALVADLRGQLAQAQPKPPAPGWSRPTGTQYVRWEDLYKPGDDFRAVMAKVDPAKYLTLPAGEFWLPDGFRDGFHSALRTLCKGIVGAGIGQTIIRHKERSTTDKNDEPKGTASKWKLIDQAAGNAGIRYGGFTLQGADQNGLLYAGLVIQGAKPTVEQVLLKAANRGTGNSPPWETFGLSVWNATDAQVVDVEIDGRDTTGTPVGSTCLGGNKATRLTLTRYHGHHPVAGAGAAFWRCTDLSTEDVVISDGNNSGLNHELCTGLVRHVRPTIKAVRTAHVQVNGSEASTKVQIVDPVFDGTKFVIGIWADYGGKPQTQKAADIAVTRSDGTLVPTRVA